MKTYDVVVIGLGAMGSSAAYHLSKTGASVLGLEQFDIPHARGSSTGFSRIIRLAYYEHPDYVPLLWSAYDLWHKLEADSREKLLYITGGVYVGPPGNEFSVGCLAAAEQYKLPHRVLSRADLAKEAPQLQIPDDFTAFYEPNAGFLLPERCIATHASMAMHHGAELHGHEPVLSWESDSTGVTVRTAKGAYRARHAIFSAGAWASRIVSDFGVQIVPTRQVLGWVWPKRPDQFVLGKIPVCFVARQDGSAYYTFPMMHDNPGFKIALHCKGRETDPDRVVRDILPGDEEEFRFALRNYFPDADGQLLAIRTCIYENSPDAHFIIDRHPKHANVTLACGFSGHGFKFASVVGHVLSELSLTGTTQHPINFLRLKRFGI